MFGLHACWLRQHFDCKPGSTVALTCSTELTMFGLHAVCNTLLTFICSHQQTSCWLTALWCKPGSIVALDAAWPRKSGRSWPLLLLRSRLARPAHCRHPRPRRRRHRRQAARCANRAAMRANVACAVHEPRTAHNLHSTWLSFHAVCKALFTFICSPTNINLGLCRSDSPCSVCSVLCRPDIWC